MLAVYIADLAIALGQAGAITHRTAGGSVFTPVIDRGNRVARSQRNDLLAPGSEEVSAVN
jgi:hypothetical protein